MKVAISATGNNLEAQVDPAFGRSKYFIIYDTDTNTHTDINVNTNTHNNTNKNTYTVSYPNIDTIKYCYTK